MPQPSAARDADSGDGASLPAGAVFPTSGATVGAADAAGAVGAASTPGRSSEQEAAVSRTDQHGRSTEPCRFKVGDRVEVKISRDSVPGRMDIISIHDCGGQWVPAKVRQLRYRQDDWCAQEVCAYAVLVQGDRDPDGVAFATPVREDDERCIRAAPPAAPRPPPRFAVGSRVECNGGARGWKAGVVREHWPEQNDGYFCPYAVELDNGGGTVMIPRDEDFGVRAEHVVEYSGEVGAWQDGKGVEAVYDVLISGKLSAWQGGSLPRVGLCGEATAVDQLSDAVAACTTEGRRVCTMLEQILSTAEQAAPLHMLVGERVRVSGLQGGASTALNGKCGLAARFVPERSRYEVKLEGNEQVVGVRDVNLALAEEPMVTCPICMDTRLTDPLGPLPKGPGEGTATVTMCCGKVVCRPCHTKFMTKGVDSKAGTFPPCPFCRQPGGYIDPLADNRVMKELLKRRATQGDPVAMYNLSGSYDAGRHGLPRDFQASLAWAALSAMVGKHVRAMNNVAFALKTGEGIRPDPRRALPWFHRAAALGHVSCVWAIGNAYSRGEGVAPDYATASRWLKRGKRLGDRQSAFSLVQLPPPHGEGL